MREEPVEIAEGESLRLFLSPQIWPLEDAYLFQVSRQCKHLRLLHIVYIGLIGCAARRRLGLIAADAYFCGGRFRPPSIRSRHHHCHTA